MIDTQLMKGILEGCVLSVIAEHETYGYEILQRLTESGFTELGEGTMYPVLTRLEKNGYIRRSYEARAIEIIDDNFNLSRREVVNVPIVGRWPLASRFWLWKT